MLLFKVVLLVAAGQFSISGRVVNALDGRPLSGAVVELEGLGLKTVTDSQGRYTVSTPKGIWKLIINREGYAPGELVNQHAGPEAYPAEAHLFPLGEWKLSGPPAFGWVAKKGLGPQPALPARLSNLPFLAQVPAQLPTTIRVARYFTTGCSGTYQRIDEIDFEDYVKGVVNAEVGVFRGVQGGPEAAAECWKAFAIAARSYALHFILTKPYDGYDINDTACNQVYKDERTPEVSAAAEATRGIIMVKAADPDIIDRYFYAASCAEHGTEPAYATGTIIPDQSATRACVGSWCGHDNCAGHADNPQVPGSDKCLVWGICQWGAVERSMEGQSFREILAHYQPNCALRDFNTPPKGILKGVVYRAPNLQDWIAGAEVTLEGGPTVVFDGVTPWSFELDPGTYTVSARAQGYLPNSVTRTVGAGETIWGSIGLESEAEEDGGADGGQDDEFEDGGDESPQEETADSGTAEDQTAGNEDEAPTDENSEEKNENAKGKGCACSSTACAELLSIFIIIFPLALTRRKSTRQK